MSLTYEKLEGNMAELTITVPAEDFKKACVDVYNRQKSKFQLDGFRKGHVPMQFIEKAYGPAVFFEDAANDLINKTYFEEIKDIDLDIVSNPEISLNQIEKGKDFIYKAKVATKPPVELGDLKKIKIEKVDSEVTDEDVEKEIESKLKANSTKQDVTDRAAQEKDEATINFEGFVDGVAFEGGKGEKYPLVLGSGSFIPGFEDQIIGKNVGDSFDVNVTFPENYQAEDLAGKEAVFKCELLGLKETVLPTLDDEYISDTTDFETVDEWKADIKKQVTERKEQSAQRERESKAIDALVEMSKVELPEPMIVYQQEKMIDNFGQQLMYQGMNLEQYLNMTGQTRDDMRDQVRPEAEKQIKRSLVIEAVAEAQNIEVSEEDTAAEIEKMAKQYQMEVDKIKEIMGEEQMESLKMDIKMQKAAEYIASQAKEK
ncbi:MAG: trigger factor [Eubacterium sp.]|nr:trigger factor [Eubacterium sp.]